MGGLAARSEAEGGGVRCDWKCGAGGQAGRGGMRRESAEETTLERLGQACERAGEEQALIWKKACWR